MGASLLLAGCGDDDKTASKPATSPPAASETAAEVTDTIKIVDFVYDPTPATVKAGTKIAISNADAAPHAITDEGSGKAFDSGTIKGKASGSFTVDTPGTYRYICEFHPFMKGELMVTK